MLRSSSLVHQGYAQVQVCDTERKKFERENVCVCVCVRERERMRTSKHMYITIGRVKEGSKRGVGWIEHFWKDVWQNDCSMGMQQNDLILTCG